MVQFKEACCKLGEDPSSFIQNPKKKLDIQSYNLTTVSSVLDLNDETRFVRLTIDSNIDFKHHLRRKA